LSPIFRANLGFRGARDFSPTLSATATISVSERYPKGMEFYYSELRHLWQAARLRDDGKSKPLMLAHGAHGKFLKINTETFAIHTLRAWRRRIQS
jgi:hypothetical protein